MYTIIYGIPLENVSANKLFQDTATDANAPAKAHPFV